MGSPSHHPPRVPPLQGRAKLCPPEPKPGCDHPSTPSSLCHRPCSSPGCLGWVQQGGPAWELLPPQGEGQGPGREQGGHQELRGCPQLQPPGQPGAGWDLGSPSGPFPVAWAGWERDQGDPALAPTGTLSCGAAPGTPTARACPGHSAGDRDSDSDGRGSRGPPNLTTLPPLP